MTRPLWQIAKEIGDDWRNVYFGARPYLVAMSQLRTIEDSYGVDSGRDIVLYFLSNAGTWRGEVARRVKAELRSLLAE